MRQLQRTVVAVGCGLACVGVHVASAQALRPEHPVQVIQTAAIAPGQLDGQVTDVHGRPLAGAAVSAQGLASQVAVSDERGRFSLRGLRPGPYFVRATVPGYAASKRELIDISPAVAAWRAFRLSPLLPDNVSDMMRPVAMASLAGTDRSDLEGESGSASHSHTPMAWRLRHLRRGILRETGQTFITDLGAPTSAADVAAWPRLQAPQHSGSAWLGGLPLTGRFQLLSASAFDSPEQLFSPGTLPNGVAYLSLGSNAGRKAAWNVQAAYSQGAMSSWVVSGRYEWLVAERHTIDLGGGYARQAGTGATPMALASLAERTRSVGHFHVFDRWAVRPDLWLSYGTRYARYDYVDGALMLSPSFAVRWSPFARTWLRASLSQLMTAPGADEFVPTTVGGVWLPPQTSFAALPGQRGFRPERTRHAEVSVERDVSGFVLATRLFRQTVNDQTVTVFDLDLTDARPGDRGHYYTTAGGDVSAWGWGVGVSRSFATRLRGAVEYSVTRAHWAESPAATWLRERATHLSLPESQRIHDVVTSIDTDIPETATRITAAYRLNTGFSAPADRWRAVPEFGARFDVQVTQRLPFLRASGAEWELLMAVRNLARDPHAVASVYDELLVIKPPKRIVGGVLVKF